MKIVTVVGARPQFIKAAPVSRAITARKGTHSIEEVLVHTGQHYDQNMSQVFFEELGLDIPRYNLGIGGGGHGQQTGKMLAALEEVLLQEEPDCVLVYGDTNSTLAGALAAVKLHISVAHVEAGLRSFNRRMPEEINRVTVDHMSELLYAPTPVSVDNLHNEGIKQGIFMIGDVMQDAVAQHLITAESKSRILRELGINRGEYLLATVHRAENTDDPKRLSSIVSALCLLAKEDIVLWPVHPRTLKNLQAVDTFPANLRLIPALSYLDMLVLEHNAKIIVTDSGGVQKEARWMEIPCVTLREETEWVETLEGNWNQLAGADPNRITRAIRAAKVKFKTRSSSCVQPAGAAALLIESLVEWGKAPLPVVSGMRERENTDSAISARTC